MTRIIICAALFLSGCFCTQDGNRVICIGSWDAGNDGSDPGLDGGNGYDGGVHKDGSTAVPDVASDSSSASDARPAVDGATPDAFVGRDAMSAADLAPDASPPDSKPADAPDAGLGDPGRRDASTDSGSARRMQIGTNFWNLDWGIWDDVFVPGATFQPGSNPWQPQFVAEVAKYSGPLRFMDFGVTNDSTERRWADRTQPGSPDQLRLAFEWMVDLCNRTGRDMWVTVPHLADGEYHRNLASLLRERLNSALKLYVEWSNETWNGMFQQTAYAEAEGNRLRLDPDHWTAAFKYHVYAAVRLFDQFDSVWGNDPRVIKVLSGWSDEPYVASVHLDALADPAINPSRQRPGVYAIAPYFGRDASTLAQARNSVPGAIQEVLRHYQLIHPTGMALVAYEGGQHMLSGHVAANRAAGMYDAYTEYLRGIAPYLDVFVHYLHNGQYGGSGAWGAEERVGQPLSTAPKLRALLDFISAP